METQEMIFRLLTAMAAGGVVGLERRLSNKSAGLKTNMLVAVGAAIFAMISAIVRQEFPNADPTRIIGQVVTGIGFLGGGVIIHRGVNVKGLTTAATIWTSAAIGSVAGLGLYKLTILATIAVIMVNLAFKPLDDFLEEKKITKNNKNEKEK